MSSSFTTTTTTVPKTSCRVALMGFGGRIIQLLRELPAVLKEHHLPASSFAVAVIVDDNAETVYQSLSRQDQDLMGTIG